MNKDVIIAINAYMRLTDAEKKEFIKYITEYEKSDYFEKGEKSKNLNESFKVIMGPISQGRCQICGK